MAVNDEPGKRLTVPRPRLGLIWLALLLALGLGVIWHFAPPLAGLVSTSRIGGPFSLTDSSGKRVTDADLAGKPYAMFFGYTHCPDVCPTTLQDMTGWLKTLGPDAAKLRMVFLTVDPERDTVPVMADYMKAFDPRILALTGSPEDVAKTLVTFRVYAKKVDVKNGDYTMDHQAAIYLMDRTGSLKTIIGFGESNEGAIAKLKDLINAG